MISKEKIFIILFFILLCILLFILYSLKDNNKTTNPKDLNIYFFKAGKADAIIISQNNQYMMIDTGEESLKSEILNYLKQHNINQLEYLLITHFDKDHVGSAAAVIQNIKIGEVIQSNVPKESSYYTNYLKALEENNITPNTITGNYNISLGDVQITVNGPEVTYEKNESNNSSLITSLTYKNHKYLFMGDCQNARIKDFLNTNNETYDFLKVPYHGHYLKRLDSLLENKQIKYAVITSSDEELEADETIDSLKKYNISYYLTRKGSITVTSDGTNIKIKQ